MNRPDLPPDCVVIAFISQRADEDPDYERTAARMLELAQAQPGFLGVESVRGADGLGITLSYWVDQAAVAAWGAHPEHRQAQRLGHERWYRWHDTRVMRLLSSRSGAGVIPDGSRPAPG
ncbi:MULTISPECIES: antibiotic biosynthesis monooxygenase family protein [unclassified Pseudomonas]|uniref:antibiotic biosynthesis monooxygenase family protein n=1 Tax=unclassified Pseudomonas TaxID=196821 RepID=UPI0023622DE1|nr:MULTISPECIES: antibiotic biosynthesis monooxygenase [unclassified Pseudomonas]MDR6178172.1 heme-degrading monooxygenase HmoA [Pseudomonas sp. SORGH_AS_0211]